MDRPKTGGDQLDLETTFVRLYSDLKMGGLPSTLERLGLGAGNPQVATLSAALVSVDQKVTIPTEILRKSANISAHKQQRLFDRLNGEILKGRASAESLVPKHPRESGAFQSYADILELCHEILLEIDTSRNLHRFHAVMSIKWMIGLPLPQIIDEQLKRRDSKTVRTTIRNTLDIIENQVRFQAVRLVGCYIALLTHAIEKAGLVDLIPSIPTLPLYLELGASDKTMISFISLGLSRLTAMKLNEQSARKDLDPAAAIQWLRTRPLDLLGLSPLLLEEVKSAIG